MTINNLDAFIDSLPDWDYYLGGCFSGKIRPTDIDGCVERNGVCLFLEHKGGVTDLKAAQERTFHTLAQQGNTVIVFWTIPNHRSGYRVRAIKIFCPEEYPTLAGLIIKEFDELTDIKASKRKLRQLVKKWFKQANKR